MCGIWGQTDHWSNPDRLPGGARSGAETSVVRRRQTQAETLSLFTRACGVTVRDWAQTSWMVESVSGSTEMVNGLGDVWSAVERLTGKSIDPLALALIQAFEARQHPVVPGHD